MNLTDALEMAVRTDPGLLRWHNEDAVFADAALGLAVLADGMGGCNAGEVASGMACALLSASFDRLLSAADGHASGADFGAPQLLAEIAAANRAIFETAQSQQRYAGMGTTLVVAWFYNNRLHLAHLGDSRVYRLRHNRFELLTKDHSLLQEQLDGGIITPEEARHSHQRNLVTRALGVDPEVDVDMQVHDALPGDLILLCSDGLNDMVADEDIGLALRETGSDLEQAAERLIRLANDNGGRDNVSVILARILGDYAASRGWWRRLVAGMK